MTREIIEKARTYQRYTLQAVAEVDEDVSLIRRALDKAGYTHVEDTEENLIECFRDYVDAGIWSNLALDNIEDITVEQMCGALLKLK